MKYDVIIIGAGAAGLMAMNELTRAGRNVCLLEAAPEAGGRILTISEAGFNEPVEAGAEFIHEGSPLTVELLERANIMCIPTGGKMIRVRDNEWIDEEAPDDHWDEFMKKIKKQESDTTIKEFLAIHFAEPKFIRLRESVQRFAEGFDLADISNASILSLENEWSHLGGSQYRVAGGYKKLTDFLRDSCLVPDSIIHYNSCAYTIKYEPGSVEVGTRDGQVYKSNKLIITCSLGMLQSGEIIFDPLPVVHQRAIEQLGFGSVIKWLFSFDKPFWKPDHEDASFFLSNQSIPAWWTQSPVETNLLTGWLGGPTASNRSNEPEELLLYSGLESLSHIFDLPIEDLHRELTHYRIYNWQADPFAKGGYSYNTLQSEQAKKILADPIYDTIYFAGEAMYAGESQGTVEAALQSGKEVSKKIKD